ncbi:MAG: hypothetical protein RL522_3045 [Pseudomonadota bacterium]|jgi:type VI secretion system secreted protein Hcp
MSDVIILEFTGMSGNCQIKDHKDKIIILSYSHSASLPMQGDIANSERTAGRPILSEIALQKMSDRSTTELYKHCTQGMKAAEAKLFVGRVEEGNYLPFFTYTMTNAMISSVSTSGGGGLPSDSFTISFSALKCEFQGQKTDAQAAGTATWNWDLAGMMAV